MREFANIDLRGYERLTLPTGGGEGTYTFQHTKPANNQCKIAAGTVVYGYSVINISETTVTLSGATEFVYIQIHRLNKTASIGHASSYPAPSSDYFYVVLVSFTATSGVYDSGIIRHKGDHFATAPI